jgi:hypothetical protein
LDEFWTQPDACPTTRQWKVGHRFVCHNCYCAAAGFLQSPLMQRKGHHNNKHPLTNSGLILYLNLRPCLGKCCCCIRFRQGRATSCREPAQQARRCETCANSQEGQHIGHSYGVDTSMVHKDPKQPTIKFHKHKTQQECARCTALKFLIRSAKRRKAANEVRNYELKLLQHRTQARWERLAYQIRVAAGSERKRAWSIGMDGYCSFKSSCFTIKACFNPMHVHVQSAHKSF